ncbi:DUF4062 domain-containing protein [Mycobacterium triplex]|uniref:DUF4062 domain-containing protein n=1 Tax=Mycobacterium triplex TaxID=47839 RepID=A0A024K1S7_9MYCO|nr:DUF4062 domain-containing protein [Mycobacterium triplex]CDO89537.1 hypothetical protein BN973_03914 [Mycobacterium triplex]
MEVRHQVFVSSTYVDLKDEREAIIQALLELDCIPAGMEMFVATDEDQWDLIKELIDLSDYYLVVVGARYGHVTPEEISFTEKEYNYALQTGKPIIAFVHADPDSVPVGVTDKDPEKAKKLEQLRKRIRDGSDGVRRNVGEFKTPDELAAKVSRAMSRAIKKYPGVGWVRGDQAMTIETQQEILNLKQKISELESDKRAAQSALVEDVEQLAQGSDEITLSLYIRDNTYPAAARKDPIYVEATTTWDELFKYIGPMMIDEATESDIKQKLCNHLFTTKAISADDVAAIREMGKDISRQLLAASWDLVSMQLRALDLIEPGTKKRQIQNQQNYLGLTQKGQRYLMTLRAIRRGVNPGDDIPPDSDDEETQSDIATDEDDNE